MSLAQSTEQQLRPSQWHPAPRFHLKPPHGWMNDPCAPGFDPSTGTFNLSYQWNPRSCDWGHICWGHASSPDGLRWEHSSNKPTMQPDRPYDSEGIFTGCSWPTGPHGEEGVLTAIYSSITALPIHWTLEHTRNSEGVSLATSTDGGRTWKKDDQNPILKGEPEGLRVTGFRDPFLAEWPSMDRVRGQKSLYAALSGGIVGQGPNVFLYAVAPDNLTKWEYLGPLVDIPNASRTPGPWTGELGTNWECTNYLTLGNGVAEREFLLTGAEGSIPPPYRKDEGDPHGAWSVWVAGSLESTPNGPRLRHEYDGILDHGCLYAPNSFIHPVSKTRVLFGWIKEEELTLERREAKGWTGYLSMPRELFFYSKANVTRGLRSTIDEVRCVKVVGQSTHGSTIETLGVRPYTDLRSSGHAQLTEWARPARPNNGLLTPKTASTSWELEVVVDVTPHHSRVGLHVCHSLDGAQRTTIYFDARSEEIVVDRSLSNQVADIKKYAMSGPFTLFYQNEGGVERLEQLRLRIFRDGDTLEVYANDRFALSSTIYVDHANCGGISWFVDGGDESPAIESIRLWEDTTAELGHLAEAPHPHL